MLNPSANGATHTSLGLAAQAGMCQAFGLGKFLRHPTLIASSLHSEFAKLELLIRCILHSSV